MKKSLIAAFLVIGAVVGAQGAEAHVIVSPQQADVAAYQTFTVSVPSEKDSSTIEVRLIMPDGLNEVTPTVKPGWSIRVKKEDPANPDRVTEISWFGGSIPSGQRDEFSFSAQVPATATTLDWTAHQIYANGDVVSWDQDPSMDMTATTTPSDTSNEGPYSQTQIVNDIAASQAAPSSSPFSWTFLISVVALALSVVSFGRSTRNDGSHHHTHTS